MQETKKVNLKKAADEFEMIDQETRVFYNTETGEFDFFTEFMRDGGGYDIDKFDEEEYWIQAPRHYDLNEYDIMADFAENVSDPQKSNLLAVALRGKGAFRRFKDTLHRIGLTEEWYAFKHNEYVKIAKEWCEDNDLEYD